MAVKGKGLGRGLDGLITESPKRKESHKEHGNQSKLKITLIEPNREQPRKKFDEDSLYELSESIKQVGILSPLLVQKKEDYYEIIAGERRWRAAKIAGLKEVPVIIKEYNQQEILEVSLIENIQREKLNPIEEAIAYKKLINEFKLKQDEVAERVSKSRTAVTNSMRLLKLDERVQKMVVDEMLSTGHARCLLGINDNELQYTIAMKVFDEKLSVRDIEKLVKDLQNQKKEKKKKVEKYDFIYNDIADKIATVVGTKVNISQKSKGNGKIEIEYYSSEELDRIMELILSIKD